MSKKLLTLGVILGLAACGGGDDADLEMEGQEVEGVAPSVPDPAMMEDTGATPMTTDTMMMDSMGDGMGM